MSEVLTHPSIHLQQFEGPLDLLYSLIAKNDIDIFDIPIAEITEMYMDYLNKMKSLDMEIASEFIVMAATLIHIKSRIMLPSKSDLAGNPEEDPREELVISLLRYKRCKMLAKELRRLRNSCQRNLRRPLIMSAREMRSDLLTFPLRSHISLRGTSSP